MADATEDRSYLAWVRSQPCAAGGCIAPAEPHHHTHGPTESEWVIGSRPKARRGVGQRAHDHYAIALCPRHHRQFHDAKGPFEGWDRERRRAWQDEQVQGHRARYLEQDTAPVQKPKRRIVTPLPSVALSLRQPWAWFMLHLAEPWRKRIENRTWGPTSHRGPFWFHASASMTKREYSEACEFAVDTVGVPAELLPKQHAVQLGGIVGIGSIVAHIRPGGGPLHFDAHERSEQLFDGREPHRERIEGLINRAWHMEGQYGYVVPDAQPVDFVQCPGMLGFWKVPTEVLEELRRQAA